MRLEGLARFLNRRLQQRVSAREPDLVIGGGGPPASAAQPYLKRWWLIPRNRVCNVYLHQVLRSDDDRALHDHPWWNLSFILAGGYVEHTIDAGGIHRRRELNVGELRFPRARAAHRLELQRSGPASLYVTWTLFMTGPVLRDWGFHCPEAGWVHWRKFTAADDKGQIGPGCGA